ncbi:hypothetical protein RA27_01695 [Ruegeria sp. ANG-R]|nr:hypothetical protein RA27_01695 [Ruegeria sp. ANG-R]
MFHVKDAEFNPTGRRASILDIKVGSIGQEGSILLAMVRWILGASQNWRQTILTARQWSSGNAVLNTPMTGRVKERSLYPITLSASLRRLFVDFADSGADETANRKML